MNFRGPNPGMRFFKPAQDSITTTIIPVGEVGKIMPQKNPARYTSSRTSKADPLYVGAYVGLIWVYSYITIVGSLPPWETYQITDASLSKALEIDDEFAGIYTFLGNKKWLRDYDIVGAEKDFKRALELNPGLANVYSQYSIFLVAIGRINEAIAKIKRAIELDPNNVYAPFILAMANAGKRMYDKGISLLERVQNIPSSATYLVYLYGKTGNT